MTKFTKIFFGKINNDKLIKSQNYERGFWDFEEDYIKLNEPINWEHGVFQYFSNNNDEFWSTVTGDFKKTKTENFIEIQNELTVIHDDFNILSNLIELITLNGGNLFDVKDEFNTENTSIQEENGIGFKFINLENFGISNIEKEKSIWVFEVLKYDEVYYNIENNDININYESSKDSEIIERFSFSVLIK